MKKQVYAGIGLGMLIGTIIGLSIAEVTGIILGALTSLLAAFFGLQSGEEGEQGNQVVIGTFSFSCVLFIFFGLYIRTHNMLTPSIANQVMEYKSLNFTDKEIKDFILFREMGLVPEGYTFSAEAKESAHKTVLMASEQQIAMLCFEVDEKSSLDEIKKAFVETGIEFQSIVNELSGSISDTTKLRNSLLLIKDAICEQSN